MRTLLLLILLALAVVLVLHFGRGPGTNPAEESQARLDEARQAALASQLRQVEAALTDFFDERGAYPADLAELVPARLPSAGLLIDPWGTPLRLDAGRGEGTFLVSAGPDRAMGSGDDMRRSL